MNFVKSSCESMDGWEFQKIEEETYECTLRCIEEKMKCGIIEVSFKIIKEKANDIILNFFDKDKFYYNPQYILIRIQEMCVGKQYNPNAIFAEALMEALIVYSSATGRYAGWVDENGYIFKVNSGSLVMSKTMYKMLKSGFDTKQDTYINSKLNEFIKEQFSTAPME